MSETVSRRPEKAKSGERATNAAVTWLHSPCVILRTGPWRVAKVDGMTESVLFALWSEGCVLCEWREINGLYQNCIPGGGIEADDHKHGDHVLAAAAREVQEELGVSVEQAQKIDQFQLGDGCFHLVMVERWNGLLRERNSDNQNALNWVPVDALIAGIALVPLKAAVEKLKAHVSWHA